MAFGLFVLVNLTLFIRPAELVPDLAEVPIYYVLILACLAVSWDRVLDKLATLSEQPITMCVIGLWVAAILSHLIRLDTWSTRYVAEKFGRVVLYFLLLISLVDSPTRLRQFLAWILAAITVMSTLAVLQYHEVLQLPGMKVLEQRQINPETGEMFSIPRLCGTGLFNDPNDLCLALTMGTVLGLYWLTDTRFGFLRFFCLLSIGLSGYTIVLTQSRGGLLGLFGALAAMVGTRFGWRKTLPLTLALVPAILLFMGGRQADIDLEGGGTGQARIRLWSEGFTLFRGAPIFGIGSGAFAEQVGHVAHNSFVHAFTELGFLGGALFTGAFYLALAPLFRLGGQRQGIRGDVMKHAQPFILALVAGYAAGLWSLSRVYIEPTYLILGVAQVYLGLVGSRATLPSWRPGLVKRLAWVGILTLVGLYTFTRFTVSYG